MNREQRRKLIKQLEKTGLTNAQAKRMLEIHESPDLKGTIKEGDRIKLNIESILKHPDWERLDTRYKQFVQDNKDRVFTAQRDPKNPDDELVMCLFEDDSDVKWRFYLSDLLKVSI